MKKIEKKRTEQQANCDVLLGVKCKRVFVSASIDYIELVP